MNTHTPTPPALSGAFDLLPAGDGSFRAVPQKPLVMASITQAARSTSLSRDTIYRLYKAGFIAGDQPSPKKIRIDMASLQTHRREASRKASGPPNASTATGPASPISRRKSNANHASNVGMLDVPENGG